MKVLLVHNTYQERGGEDSVVEAERDMLANNGVDVETHLLDNHAIVSLGDRIRTFRNVRANPQAADAIACRARDGGFDVVHVHNFFPLASPATHTALAAIGIPVVQTLHNYRLLCANGMLMREDRICEACLGATRLPALVHRCYRGSFAGTLAVLQAQNASIRDPSWRAAVTRFIALTQFARDKFASAGLPEEKIVVKSNLAPDPGPGLPPAERSGALFVGRIAPGKGVPLLVETWKSLPHIPLTIVGTGPQLDSLRQIAPPHIQFAGLLPRDEVFARMKQARFLIMPSTWYEGFGLNIIEAMACGLPTIVSRLGGLPELVEDGRNGFLFAPGDGIALRETVLKAFSPETQWEALSYEARQSYEHRFSAQANFGQLLRIYKDATNAVRPAN